MSEAGNSPSLSLTTSVCPACGFASPAGFRFCGSCGASIEVGARESATAPFPPWLADPQRRQLTVLFCDLVDSTSLAGRLDLEEFRDVIHAFQAACSTVIRRFDGTISRYMGDGMLVLFGYPCAHEDDAERAVRAGLSMIEAIVRLQAPVGAGEPLAIRVGIATGLVVVGDLIGEGAAEEEAVLGETPNLAARLHAVALPNTVVIASGTRSLLGERFICEDLGARSLKGFVAAVPVWRVLAPRSGDSRFEAANAARPTPLVDREEELGWLLGLWQSAAQQRGRAALLAGEAGIGKSRIVAALRERIADAPGASLHFQCSPYYVNRALHPVIQHIESAAGIGAEDRTSCKLEKLSAWLGTVEEAGDALSLLAALLSIPVDDLPPLPPMSAQRQKTLTLDLLFRIVERRSLQHPLLVVFEDLHWVDPTTQESLSLLIARAHDMSVLVVFTFRSDFSPPWNDAHVERRELRRLTREQSFGLVEQVAGAGRFSRAVMEQVVAKTDGIPLFLEELTRAVLGTEVPTVDGRSCPISAPPTPFAIPSTLHDSLMARLDQLGSAKFVAQLASTIGREFSYALLEAVAALPSQRLREGLQALEHAGLVYAEPSLVGEGYAFKHALVQEVAYQTLLRSRRRELHVRIAEVLEQQFPQTTRDAPELVAHHWTEGGDAARAVARWLAAGERASARSEYREAIGHLRRGIDLLAQIDDPAERCDRELALLLALGPAVIMANGGGNPEVVRVYSRCVELCADLPKSKQHFAAYWGWWRASMDQRSGRQRADELLGLAQELGDPALLLQAHHCEWATTYMLGAHDECCRHIEAGLALYDPEQHRAYATIYGHHDAKVCALGEWALACWLLGRADEALEHVRSALVWAEALSHVGSRVHAMDYALVLHMFRRDVPEVARRANELVSYATEQQLPDHRAKGAVFRGWARTLHEDASGGLSEMRDALTVERDAGTPEDFPLYYEMFAEACQRAGRFEEGLSAVRQGFGQAEQRGLVYWNAELHRRRGELLLLSGRDRDAASACFRRALDCARAQGARSLELRAAISLARLCRDEGRATEAASILRPVYSAFTQGFGAPDLIEARRLLLEELA